VPAGAPAAFEHDGPAASPSLAVTAASSGGIAVVADSAGAASLKPDMAVVKLRHAQELVLF
jgi:hypothetical protein